MTLGLSNICYFAHYAYDMSMTSVYLSLPLVDCDHTVQEKVEISIWQPLTG